ncbi:MAG: RsiV family protein [Bacteroidia bacterium]
MKHLRFFFFAAISLSLVACGGDKSSSEGTMDALAQTSENAAASTLPATFYMKLKGTIGDGIPVTMDLIREDTTLTGTYYYDKIGMPLNLYGSVKGDEMKFRLRESNAQYDETGTFEGKFLNAATIEGTWTNAKNKKQLPFNLQESRDGIMQVAFEEFHEEDCGNRDKNLKNPKAEDEGWWTDTLCSSIDLFLVKVTGPDAGVAKSINEAIEKAIGSDGVGDVHSIEDHMNSVHKLEADEYMEMEEDCGIVTNEPGLFVVSIGTYEFSGGAHPNSWVTYLNFDSKTGRRIQLEELLKPGARKDLDRIGERLFNEQNGGESEGMWDFEPGKFTLNDNFAIQKGGITFVFNPYDIGPYVAGAPAVFIAYKEFKHLIKEGSVISNLTL